MLDIQQGVGSPLMEKRTFARIFHGGDDRVGCCHFWRHLQLSYVYSGFPAMVYDPYTVEVVTHKPDGFQRKRRAELGKADQDIVSGAPVARIFVQDIDERLLLGERSEERRVGNAWRSRWAEG